MNANQFTRPEDEGYWGLRPCLREPVPEIALAASELSQAADAYLAGDIKRCIQFVQQADKIAIREWIESLWGSNAENPLQPMYLRRRAVADKPPILPKEQRPALRMPSLEERRMVLAKWGWNCAYCGIPLISTKARNVLRGAIGGALRWGPRNSDKHSAFQCMTIEFDHVVPHAIGGDSSLENTVPACGPCNCGKFDRMLEEHGLDDPRGRFKGPTDWDGLGRLTPNGAL